MFSYVFLASHKKDSVDPDQTPQNVASDHGLHDFFVLFNIEFY